MRAYGFGRVPDKGFFSHGESLEKGEWGEVALPLPAESPAASLPLLEMNGPQLWKWMQLYAIHSLLMAFGFGPDRAAADSAWDDTQRKLHLTTALALLSADIDLRAAAQRVRDHLLLGDGLGQTQLAYQAEVDFGFRQLKLARSDAFSADIQRLGLTDVIAEVEATTRTLASAIGHAGGDQSSGTTTQRERERHALHACQSACNTVLGDIDHLLAQSPSPTDQQRLLALRLPLATLLDRYPKGGAAAPDAPEASHEDPSSDP
jgi:hypothetical protein